MHYFFQGITFLKAVTSFTITNKLWEGRGEGRSDEVERAFVP